MKLESRGKKILGSTFDVVALLDKRR